MYKSISWICLYHPGSISNAVYLNLTNVFSQLSLCAMTQIYTGYGFRRARTEIALRDKLFATHTHTLTLCLSYALARRLGSYQSIIKLLHTSLYLPFPFSATFTSLSCRTLIISCEKSETFKS